jgi:hypothetical protein
MKRKGDNKTCTEEKKSRENIIWICLLWKSIDQGKRACLSSRSRETHNIQCKNILTVGNSTCKGPGVGT